MEIKLRAYLKNNVAVDCTNEGGCPTFEAWLDYNIDKNGVWLTRRRWVPLHRVLEIRLIEP